MLSFFLAVPKHSGGTTVGRYFPWFPMDSLNPPISALKLLSSGLLVNSDREWCVDDSHSCLLSGFGGCSTRRPETSAVWMWLVQDFNSSIIVLLQGFTTKHCAVEGGVLAVVWMQHGLELQLNHIPQIWGACVRGLLKDIFKGIVIVFILRCRRNPEVKYAACPHYLSAGRPWS